MSQLPITVESIPESVVTEGRLEIEVSTLTDANFKLILCPGISDDFPVVDPLSETFIGDDSSEQILLFFQE